MSRRLVSAEHARDGLIGLGGELAAVGRVASDGSGAERRRQTETTPVAGGRVRPIREPVILPGYGISLLSRHAPERAGGVSSLYCRGVLSLYGAYRRMAHMAHYGNCTSLTPRACVCCEAVTMAERSKGAARLATGGSAGRMRSDQCTTITSEIASRLFSEYVVSAVGKLRMLFVPKPIRYGVLSDDGILYYLRRV